MVYHKICTLSVLISLCLNFCLITGWTWTLRFPKDMKTCYKQFQEASLHPHPDTGLQIDEILTKYGYPSERINVTTDDGYILGVFRIPYGKRSPLIDGQKRKAVILSHGIFMNAQEYLVQHEDNNLAMLLADSGIDVFLYNSRGNHYSQGHIDPNMPADNPFNLKYWDFSFHEMGVYDIPAVMSAVTNLTGNEKMFFIGHSMGTSAYFASKIDLAILLSPNGYLGHSALLPFTPFGVHSLVLSKFLFSGKFFDHPQRFQKLSGIPVGMLCASPAMACGVCSNFLFGFFGYNGPHMNYTTLPLMLNSMDTGSLKSMIHLAQAMLFEKLCQFDYLRPSLNEARYGKGRISPPCYDLGSVTAPTVMYWGESDNLAPPKDVFKTASALHRDTLKALVRVNSPLFNHMDFAFAKDARILLYNDIIERLKNV